MFSGHAKNCHPYWWPQTFPMNPLSLTCNGPKHPPKPNWNCLYNFVWHEPPLLFHPCSSTPALYYSNKTRSYQSPSKHYLWLSTLKTCWQPNFCPPQESQHLIWILKRNIQLTLEALEQISSHSPVNQSAESFGHYNEHGREWIPFEWLPIAKKPDGVLLRRTTNQIE